MEYITINSIDYSEAELRKLWLEEYCNQEVITFDGIKVKFFEDKFDHAFYESSKRNSKDRTKEGGYKDCLSHTRLDRILWIKEVLNDPSAELYVGFDKGKKSYDNSSRVAVVKGDYAVIIRLINNKNARFITAYVADNSIEKIKKSPKWEIKKDAD